MSNSQEMQIDQNRSSRLRPTPEQLNSMAAENYNFNEKQLKKRFTYNQPCPLQWQVRNPTNNYCIQKQRGGREYCRLAQEAVQNEQAFRQRLNNVQIFTDFEIEQIITNMQNGYINHCGNRWNRRDRGEKRIQRYVDAPRTFKRGISVITPPEDAAASSNSAQ